MTISVIDTAFAFAENEPITITHGFTIQAGDVILAFVNQNAGQDAGLGNAFSDNNGANSFRKDLEYWATPSTAASDAALAIFTRVAGASEPTSYSFNGSTPATQVWAIGLIQLRGVDTTNIWDVPPRWANLGENLTGTAHIAPSITTAIPNSLAVYLVGGDARNLYSTPTNSFTDANITGAVQGTDWAMGGAYKTITAAGAVGATQMTAGSSNDGGAMLMAFRNAGESDPVPNPTMRVVEGALSDVVNGAVDFVVPGIGSIAGAIVFTNRCTIGEEARTTAGESWFCDGFWDGTTQCCYSHYSELGLTTPSTNNSKNAYSATKIAMGINAANTVEFAATIANITDGVRITTTVAANLNTRRCVVILIPSSIVSSIDVQVLDRSGIDASGIVEVTNVGFAADAVFVLGGRATAAETTADDFCHSFGVALNAPDNPNYCMNLIEDNGRDLSTQTTYLSNITNNVHCALNNSNAGIRWGMRITNFDSQGFTTQAFNEYVHPLTTFDTNGEDVLLMAIKFNGVNIDACTMRNRTVTGDYKVIAPGWQPSFGLVMGSEGVDNNMASGESTQAESFSMIPFDGRHMQSIGWDSGDNLATVTGSTYSLPEWRMVEDAGVPGTNDTYIGTLKSFDPNGVTFNFTTAQTTLDFWNLITLSTEAPGPVLRNTAVATVLSATNVVVDCTHFDLRRNDILVCVAHINNNPTVTVSGFTSEFAEENPGVATSHQAFLWKVIDEDWDGNKQFTVDWGTADRGTATMLHFRNVDVWDLFDVAPSASTRAFEDSATTLSSPVSLTTTAAKTIGIGAFFHDGTGTFSGHTNGYDNEIEDGTNECVSVVFKNYDTAGAKGTVNATLSLTADIVGHHFAVKGYTDTSPRRVQLATYDSEGTFQTQVPLVLPATPKAGNLLVAHAAFDKTVTFNNPPAGWTRIVSDQSNAGVSQQTIYKISDGTESGVTMSISTTQVSCCGTIMEYENVDTLDVTASNSQGTPAQTCSSGTTGTTTQAEALAIAFFAADTAQNVFDVSRAYSNDFVEYNFKGAANAGTPSSQIADKRLSATGTVETTFTTGDTGDEMLGAVAVFYLQSGPVITDVANSGETPGAGSESWQDGSTGNVISGTGFVA